MFRWLFGDKPQRHYEEGMRLYNRGEMEEALDHFDQALQGLADENHPYGALARFYRAEAQARLGARLLRDGKDTQALHYLDAAIGEQPGYPDLHFRKAVALFRLGESDPAVQAAMDALEINGDLAEARILLSVILRSQGETEAAEAEVDRARNSGRRRPTALTRFLDSVSSPLTAEELWEHLFDEESLRRRIERAESLYLEGKLEESRELLEQLTRSYPDFPDLRLKLALILFREGEQATALVHLEHALSVHPDFVVLSAAVLLHQGEVERARRRYEEARSGAALASPFADYGLAVCRHLVGDEEGCGELIRPLMSQGQVPWEVRTLLAGSRALLGHYELARAAYSDFDCHAPHEQALLDAVSFHLETSEFDAIRRCLAPLAAEGEDPVVILAEARLLERLERGEEALRILQAYTAQHGIHPALSVFEARLLSRGGEVSVALKRLMEVQDRWPESAPALRERVRILVKESRVVEALEEQEKLAAMNGASLEDEVLRLQLLRRAERVEEAESLAHRLAQVHPLSLLVRLQQRVRWLAPLSVEPLPQLGTMEEASSEA